MRVLLVKTSSLGDVIHTLPALTDAQQAIPGIRFDWIVEEGLAEIPGWHPAVDQVIPVAIRRWRKNLMKTWRSGEWRDFKRHLKSRHYDLIIDAQGLLKSAVLTRLNPAPTAGYDRESIREPIASRFYQRHYKVSRQQHAVERIRSLFAQALDYPIPAPMGQYGLNTSKLSKALVPFESYLVFCHGTTWVSKLWPAEYWKQLAKLADESGLAVMLPWGNAEEHQRAKWIASGISKAHVLPKASLNGLAGLLAAARGVVSVDTGLGHLAAAVAVPTVALYGPTDPSLSGCYGSTVVNLSSHLSCAPCLQKHCVLKPEQKKSFAASPPCFAELNPERVWRELSRIITPHNSDAEDHFSSVISEKR